MNETVFYTVYDDNFKELGDALIKSVERFYPSIPMKRFVYPLKDGKFDLRDFCMFLMVKGKELLEEYKRIIYIDADSVMINFCPDFFGDFDMAVVRNNIPVGKEYGGKSGVYVNAGLVVCTNKEVWQEYIDEYERRCNNRWEDLNQQNSLNKVFHESKFNVKLLEFPDRVYDISSESYYSGMITLDDEIYVPGVFNGEKVMKKVCLFHWAGVAVKDKEKGAINWDKLWLPEKEKEKIRSFYA